MIEMIFFFLGCILDKLKKIKLFLTYVDDTNYFFFFINSVLVS